MKKPYNLFFLLITVLFILAVFYSCSDDNAPTTTVPNQTTITGTWQADQVQMVQAPQGNSISALMKQALVPFGNMPASSVGYCTVNLNNDSTWNLTGNITNMTIKVICRAYDSIYTAGGVYTYNTSNSTITLVVTYYSGSPGNQTVGSGTYSLTSNLVINLNLANNEKWKITLKR